MTPSPTVASERMLIATSPRSRRLGVVACGLILLMVTIALPFWSLGAEYRSEQNVTVGSAQLVDDDLYVFANAFTLDGRVSRDVVAGASMIEINGSITGSLNAVGGDITIPGTVGRSVRIVSGDTAISGTISGDLLLLGGTTTIENDGVIEGDVQVYGGTLDMDGTIDGNLSGNVADLNINGFVAGDVSIDVQNLDVTSQANIGGTLDYVSPIEADVAAGAQIDGSVDRQTVAPWGGGNDVRSRFFSPLVRTVWLLVTGAVIVALAPRFATTVSSNVRRPWIAAIVGVLAVGVVPLVALGLMITVIGLPMGLILVALFVIALYLSQIVVGQRIGMLLLPRSWNDGSRGYQLLAMSVGVILLSALRFIPVPFVSSVVNLLVAVVGLGAAVLLVRQLRPRRISAASA